MLPTAWQAVAYADVPPGGTVTVLGLGPIGDMAARIALHKGASKVIGVDLVPERLRRARSRGVEVLNLKEHGKDLGDRVRDLTDGRGTDAVIDAVGMEAHGAPLTKLAQKVPGFLPDAIAQKMMTKAGVDSMAAFDTAVDVVRRGGTISLSGVYGGAVDPVPMFSLFDKQIQLRMGQANVWRWVETSSRSWTTPTRSASTTSPPTPCPGGRPQAYKTFQDKEDGMIKTVLTPGR